MVKSLLVKVAKFAIVATVGYVLQEHANQKNPNNPAHAAAQNNRANQMNPNNPAYYKSRANNQS